MGLSVISVGGVDVVDPQSPALTLIGIGGKSPLVKSDDCACAPLLQYNPQALQELETSELEVVCALEIAGNETEAATVSIVMKRVVILCKFFILDFPVYLVLYLGKDGVELVRAALVDGDHEPDRIVA